MKKQKLKAVAYVANGKWVIEFTGHKWLINAVTREFAVKGKTLEVTKSFDVTDDTIAVMSIKADETNSEESRPGYVRQKLSFADVSAANPFGRSPFVLPNLPTESLLALVNNLTANIERKFAEGLRSDEFGIKQTARPATPPPMKGVRFSVHTAGVKPSEPGERQGCFICGTQFPLGYYVPEGSEVATKDAEQPADVDHAGAAMVYCISGRRYMDGEHVCGTKLHLKDGVPKVQPLYVSEEFKKAADIEAGKHVCPPDEPPAKSLTIHTVGRNDKPGGEFTCTRCHNRVHAAVSVRKQIYQYLQDGDCFTVRVACSRAAPEIIAFIKTSADLTNIEEECTPSPWQPKD